MARSYDGVGPAPRILVLMLLVLALGIGGLVWFDYLGLIDVKETFAPILQSLGVKAPVKIVNAEDPLLLDRERLGKQTEALDIGQEQLDTNQKELQTKEAEVQQKLAALDEQQKALAEQQKSFNDSQKQYENRTDNLRKVAVDLVSMPPDKAVAQLVNMSDQDVIDVLRLTDQVSSANGQNSLVPYWLSLMPADRAATIERKMIRQPSQAAASDAIAQQTPQGG